MWVQCEVCFKWCKLFNGVVFLEGNVVWFCSLNLDFFYQNCIVFQEIEVDVSVKSLLGFYKDGIILGQLQNVVFFVSVLKMNVYLYDECVRWFVIWFVSFNFEKLVKLVIVGLVIF